MNILGFTFKTDEEKLQELRERDEKLDRKVQSTIDSFKESMDELKNLVEKREVVEASLAYHTPTRKIRQIRQR